MRPSFSIDFDIRGYLRIPIPTPDWVSQAHRTTVEDLLMYSAWAHFDLLREVSRDTLTEFVEGKLDALVKAGVLRQMSGGRWSL